MDKNDAPAWQRRGIMWFFSGCAMIAIILVVAFLIFFLLWTMALSRIPDRTGPAARFRNVTGRTGHTGPDKTRDGSSGGRTSPAHCRFGP